jgi:hypothetical protein
MAKIALVEEIRAAQAEDVAPEAQAEAKAEAQAEATSGFVIEDNVAMPSSSERKAKYPWKELTKGQSFFIPGAKVETFYTLCSSASKKHGGKFIARKWDGPNGVAGVRVWKSE